MAEDMVAALERLTDDEQNAHAVRLATQASDELGNPIVAGLVLLQAGLAALMSALPPAGAIAAMEFTTSEMISQARDMLHGPGQTRQ